MPLHNAEIASIFRRVADQLEIRNGNPFRIRAYRTAAWTIGSLKEELADMLDRGERLTTLPGIGNDLAAKITEIIHTGTLGLLEDLEKDLPHQLTLLMKIPGLGGKRIAALHTELGISNLEDLQKAVDGNKISTLAGFGTKIQENIREGIQHIRQSREAIPLPEAQVAAADVISHLKKNGLSEEIVVAGSYRRNKETIRDIDVLVTTRNRSAVMERFISYEGVEKIISHGTTRSSIILRSGIQVDIRAVEEESFGAALVYFTGSKEHNIAIRKIAIQKGLKINEYGVFKGERRIAGKTEQEVYASIGLAYIPPELRENRGEIEAAQGNSLPQLIELKNIRGDLHVHSRYTDGHATIREMADAYRARHYEYMAITDHSKRVRIAHGLSEQEIKRQIDEIDKINKSSGVFTVLKGSEVDILEDGSLDLPDSILQKLDLTVCSIHSKFNLTETQQTERIEKAMKNPYFTIFAHPTGRLINERKPYAVDFQRVIQAARRHKRILELNAQPSRLDINDVFAKAAKDAGVAIAVSTDSHSIGDIDNMEYGIMQGRRGWLEAGDVVNTYPLTVLKRTFLKR